MLALQLSNLLIRRCYLRYRARLNYAVAKAQVRATYLGILSYASVLL
jgi:hypothetical protein